MSDKKCFLDNCEATVGDCYNIKCRCLTCLGVNKCSCDTLQDEKKSQMQKMMCEQCKNYNGR